MKLASASILLMPSTVKQQQLKRNPYFSTVLKTNLKMEKKEFADLSTSELLREKKKIQHNKIANATIIGVCVGIFIFAAVRNGFSFFTFFPLLLTYPFIKNGRKTKVLEEELKSRNLV